MATASDRSSTIQRELEASLARITELTTLNEQLTERLVKAKHSILKATQEREQLASQLDASISTNTTLADELARCRAQVLAPNAVDSETGGPSDAAQTLHQLRVAEQENLELVKQLCALKETHFQLDRARVELETRVRELEVERNKQRHDKENERVTTLETYMETINQRLEGIEQEKHALVAENTALMEQIASMKRDSLIKSELRDCWTETDASLDRTYQDLETRIVVLQSQLECERRRCEELQRNVDAERIGRLEDARARASDVECEKQTYETLVAEIRTAHHQLQQEFLELQTATEEATTEAEKRIVFLTKCVDECARLVDAPMRDDERLTLRDIYDTIVSVSKNLVVIDPGKKKASSKIATAGSRTKPPGRSNPTRSPAPAHTKPGDRENQLDSEGKLTTLLDAELWRVRAAKFEEQLRGTILKTKTFEDMVGHLEMQMDALRVEIKERMTHEASLLNKHNTVKLELSNAKAQCATLTSRLDEATSDLKRRQTAQKTMEGELARLRAAVQRKTELLNRQKAKVDEQQIVLDAAMSRIAQLEANELSIANMQQKAKDQARVCQELRQQCAVLSDAQMALAAELDKTKEQANTLQSRAKSLRQENALLRQQIKSDKKSGANDAAGSTAQTPPPATATATPQELVGEAKTTSISSHDAEQIKALKRRVLQKQDVIVRYKAKILSLEADLAAQRNQLAQLTQSTRQQQQIHREKQQSMIESVSNLREELDSALTLKTEQFDGLRASIYDACELYVECDPVHEKAAPLAASDDESEVGFDDGSDVDTTSGLADEILLELRRYAHLSSDDLAELHLDPHSGRTIKKQHGQDKQAMRRLHQQQQYKEGQRLLYELERALENTPQDCRVEIARVLEFVSGGIRQRGVVGA